MEQTGVGRGRMDPAVRADALLEKKLELVLLEGERTNTILVLVRRVLGRVLSRAHLGGRVPTTGAEVAMDGGTLVVL